MKIRANVAKSKILIQVAMIFVLMTFLSSCHSESVQKDQNQLQTQSDQLVKRQNTTLSNNLALNPGMETASGTRPASWVMGSQEGIGYRLWERRTSTPPGTHSGSAYGRLVFKNGSGKWGWIITERNISVTPGSTIRVDAYFRANMPIQLQVRQFNSSGAEIVTTKGNIMQPGQWTWYSYLTQTRTADFRLNSQTTQIQVAFLCQSGTNSSDYIVDIDDVSVNVVGVAPTPTPTPRPTPTPTPRPTPTPTPTPTPRPTPTPTPTPSGQFEVGGSNYVSWYVEPGLVDPMADAISANKIKHVVYKYHENPSLVRQHLQGMCNGGQRKITLMIWFTNATWMKDPTWNNAYGIITNSQGGQLAPYIKNNLINLLTVIKDLRTTSGASCYNELLFRFAPWSGSISFSWSAWNEALYQENKNFIFSTRSVVEQTLSGSAIKRTYDLGAEEGGRSTEGQAARYMKQLWYDYGAAFGFSDSYGFSIAVYPGRGLRSVQVYDQIGVRPKEYALDVYELSAFKAVLAELKAQGESKKPIVIQETFYNDAEYMAAIHVAAAEYGFKIRTVMQWPILRSNPYTISMSYTPDYYNNLPGAINLPKPVIYSAGLGCVDRKCIWLNGANFSSSCYVDLYSSDWVYLGHPEGSATCTNTQVTFKIPEHIYASRNSLRIVVVNAALKWNDPYFYTFR